MPPTKIFSLLNIRRYGRSKQEEDPAEVQQALDREELELEIGHQVETCTAKQIKQWEALYGRSTSPTSLFHDSGIGSPVTMRKGSSESEDIFRSQSIDQACQALESHGARDERYSLKVVVSFFRHDDDEPDQLEEDQHTDPEITPLSEPDNACEKCMAPDSAIIGDSQTGGTTMSTRGKPVSLRKCDSFDQPSPQEYDYASEGNVSTTPVVDEWLHSRRGAMSGAVFPPSASCMASGFEHSHQRTFLQKSIAGAGASEQLEDEIIIDEEDPARLQPSSTESTEAALIPMYISPELEGIARVSRGQRAHRTVEWIKHTADPDAPTAQNVSSEDPSEPSASIHDVFPDHKAMFDQGLDERRRRRNCVCWPGFVGVVVPLGVYQGSHAQDTASVIPPSTSLPVNNETSQQSSEREQELEMRRQTKRDVTSLPRIDTTLMGQRRRILAYRNGMYIHTPTQQTSTPTSTHAGEESHLTSPITQHTDLDPDDMTLTQRRAVLLSRRAGTATTTAYPSPSSPHQCPQSPPRPRPNPQTTTDRNLAHLHALHARQTHLLQTWRENLADAALASSNLFPPSDPLLSSDPSTAFPTYRQNRCRQNIHAEVLLRKKREEMRREEARVWLSGRRKREWVKRESLMREWMGVQEEAHRRVMREMQRGADVGGM